MNKGMILLLLRTLTLEDQRLLPTSLIVRNQYLLGTFHLMILPQIHQKRHIFWMRLFQRVCGNTF